MDNNSIIPLAIGFILGNDKMRNQVALGLQQLAGQGVDLLNTMEPRQGVNNVPNKQPVPRPKPKSDSKAESESDK